jgi:hypothetical protein
MSVTLPLTTVAVAAVLALKIFGNTHFTINGRPAPLAAP